MAQVRRNIYAKESQRFPAETDEGRRELWISVTFVQIRSAVLAERTPLRSGSRTLKDTHHRGTEEGGTQVGSFRWLCLTDNASEVEGEECGFHAVLPGLSWALH